MIQPVYDVSVIGPSGELDTHEGRRLLREICSLVRHEWSKIVIDLGEVEHIHYAWLQELSALSEFLDERIRLANPAQPVRDVLRLAGGERPFWTID